MGLKAGRRPPPYGIMMNVYGHKPKTIVPGWPFSSPSDSLCRSKPTWPGRLDTFVSGGLSSGLGVLETAVKEAEEEANVSRDVAKGMVAAGTVGYGLRTNLYNEKAPIWPL